MDKPKRYLLVWDMPKCTVDWATVTVELEESPDFEAYDDYNIAVQAEHLRRRDGMMTMLIDLHENGYELVEVEE